MDASLITTSMTALFLAIGPAEGPASRSAPPSTSPAADKPAAVAPAAVDPEVERILDRLERRGDTINDIRCAVEYTTRNVIIDDPQKYKGELLFKRDKPDDPNSNAKFKVRFDSRQYGRTISRKKEWHIFDGRWYIEARETTKTIKWREVVGPGEKVNPFRVGEGPFPVPFGQKKADILKNFRVTLVPSKPADPPGADHLECIPIPGTKLAADYARVHFYIDRKSDLPVKVVSVTKSQGQENQEVTAAFSKTRTNTGIPGSEFLPPKKRPGWTETKEPLSDAPATPPTRNQ